jgi:hypothetical protein
MRNRLAVSSRFGNAPKPSSLARAAKKQPLVRTRLVATPFLPDGAKLVLVWRLLRNFKRVPGSERVGIRTDGTGGQSEADPSQSTLGSTSVCLTVSISVRIVHVCDDFFQGSLAAKERKEHKDGFDSLRSFAANSVGCGLGPRYEIWNLARLREPHRQISFPTLPGHPGVQLRCEDRGDGNDGENPRSRPACGLAESGGAVTVPVA